MCTLRLAIVIIWRFGGLCFNGISFCVAVAVLDFDASTFYFCGPSAFLVVVVVSFFKILIGDRFVLYLFWF